MKLTLATNTTERQNKWLYAEEAKSWMIGTPDVAQELGFTGGNDLHNLKEAPKSLPNWSIEQEYSGVLVF